MPPSAGILHDGGDVRTRVGAFRNEDDGEGHPGTEGVGHQMRPFEEDLIGMTVSGVAAARDERMTTTGECGIGHGGGGQSAVHPYGKISASLAQQTRTRKCMVRVRYPAVPSPGTTYVLEVKAQLLRKFEDEISALDRELKTELPKEIQRARELGDLRENAEYQAAKERQTFLQARIGMLKKRMADISLINLDKIPTGKVAFGSTVTLREDGETVVYQLVMPEDADAAKGMISTASPIGRALLGKEEGDEVTVPTPNGQRSFELIKLVTIHD